MMAMLASELVAMTELPMYHKFISSHLALSTLKMRRDKPILTKLSLELRTIVTTHSAFLGQLAAVGVI